MAPMFEKILLIYLSLLVNLKGWIHCTLYFQILKNQNLHTGKTTPKRTNTIYSSKKRNEPGIMSVYTIFEFIIVGNVIFGYPPTISKILPTTQDRPCLLEGSKSL